VTAPASAEFVIEPLGPVHDRHSFDCGVAALNSYLQKQARQDRERGVAVAYVLARRDDRAHVAGFYTLSATSVKLDGLPASVRKKLPKYPVVPATLLGRLAVRVNHQGRRFGERLLVDALRRSLAASSSVGAVAVVVDAKDPSNADFYARYGFIRCEDSPLRLFIMMKTVAELWPSP
jgi:predicted GNAT family N-acyltransferase